MPSSKCWVSRLPARQIHFATRQKQGGPFLVISPMVKAYDDEVAGTVILADFVNCIDRPVELTSDNLSAWRTEKDIGLGSSVEDVRRAYGTETTDSNIEGRDYPWIIQGSANIKKDGEIKGLHAQLGDKVLNFDGGRKDLRSTTFGFSKGKVVWIAMSQNE